jgi:hypothetical protein
MSFESYVFWHKLDWKGKLAYTGFGVLMVVGALALFRFAPTGAEAKVALRSACAGVSAPMSPATLYDHFPEGTYTPRCLAGTDGCTEFTTRDGHAEHYPCANNQCVMYWRSDGWGCRVRLSDGDQRAQGPGEIQNSSGTWSRLD